MSENNDLHFVDAESKNFQMDATRIYHSWGLQQRTIDRLLYCGITTLEHLQDMSADDVQVVFKEDSQLGEKILFRKNLKQWREHNGFDELQDTNASVSDKPQSRMSKKEYPLKISEARRCSWESDSSVPGTAPAKLKHVDLRDLLRSTHKGITILNSYDKNCTLTNSEQSQISHVIVDYHMTKDPKMTPHQMAYYAKDIVKAFPSELESTYYVPRNKTGNKCPQGKLYHRYSNEHAKLKRRERDMTPSD